jgi:hypothetical protein
VFIELTNGPCPEPAQALAFSQPISVILVVQYNSNYPNAGYPDQLGTSGDFVKNSAKLICLEITGYWMEQSTVKCYGSLELQVRHG